MIPRLLAGALLLLCLPAVGQNTFIAIIIDDVGNDRARGERAIALPAPLTFSILPNSPHASHLADLAYTAGREIMVHMPMANVSGKRLGPGALVESLDKEKFASILGDALERLPQATGLNNHMGSLLTTQTQPMGWLMEEIKRRRMFFIDSRTTAKTVALEVAQAHAVSGARRDVFLDNRRDAAAIHEAFELLLDKAQRQRVAIAIGHPHEATLDFLDATLPTLSARGVTVIPVSHAIALQRILAPPAIVEATD